MWSHCRVIPCFIGTGSYPPETKGLQRKMRQAPRRQPRTTPCTSIASIVYWEHEGVYLQHRGTRGLMQNWYIRIMEVRIFTILPSGMHRKRLQYLGFGVDRMHRE